MKTIALPAISHLPCAAWWRSARALVARRRAMSPRRLQKLRPERKRREKLAPTLIAQYLAGDSCRVLAERHGTSVYTMAGIVRYGTSDAQKRERTTRVEREKRQADKGIEFPAPEFVPEQAVPMRTGAMIWRSIVRQSCRFILAGCDPESARMLATEIVEKFGDVCLKS